MTIMKQEYLAKANDTPTLMPDKIDSVILSLLIEEVRNSGDQDHIQITAYNRTYHRHNR